MRYLRLQDGIQLGIQLLELFGVCPGEGPRQSLVRLIESLVTEDDERIIVQSIGEQIGLALESARLFEDTQRNAWRDQVVSETTAQVWSSTEIEAVLQAAVQQLGEKLGASEVVIRLGTEEELS